MANELTLSGLRIQFTKANCPSVDFQAPTITPTVTGTVISDNVQDVGFAAEEAILLGDAGAGGWMFVQNMDATNFVVLRAATAAADMIKLLKGEWAVFRCPAAAPYIQADTGACKVRILHFVL